jgi:hypothetical protein
MPAAVSVIISVLHEAREVGALLPHWRELRRGCQCMQAADWAGAIRADQGTAGTQVELAATELSHNAAARVYTFAPLHAHLRNPVKLLGSHFSRPSLAGAASAEGQEQPISMARQRAKAQGGIEAVAPRHRRVAPLTRNIKQQQPNTQYLLDVLALTQGIDQKDPPQSLALVLQIHRQVAEKDGRNQTGTG